jgi:superfamily I DNA/RNA helicase/mRNA-degrading endonuclease RelE of RelBE toxin-antitoxin system
MEFRISDTFTDSLAKLSNQDQKSVKTTAFDLQMDPSNPGMKFHKLDRAQDPNFSSVRVSKDLRVIVHRSKSSFLLCYAGHHDDAYKWAQKRKFEIHPKTGAAQLVEVRKTIEEVVVPVYVVEERAKPPLFSELTNDELLGYGVPAEWLKDVLLATEDTILELAAHLPHEAAEALLELAVGGTPEPAPVFEIDIDPFEHPDALRRFRVMGDQDELERALEFPWEKWTIFLHPQQRHVATKDFNGPARVSGSAGTGKTVVALHRAVHLAKNNPDARVMLATFSETLANALKTKLRRLLHNQPQLGDQIEVLAMNDLGERLHRINIHKAEIAPYEIINTLIMNAAQKVEGHSFGQKFLVTEWEQVVDAWQLENWEEYRDVARLGRRTRLPESRRKVLWEIYEIVRADLNQRGLITYSRMFGELTKHYSEHSSPFEFMVIDESQDINVPQLKFLATLSNGRPNSLFFAGDLGQRIFQQPFSWKSLGVDIRGRSSTLRINYRTSHQIRMEADKLLDPEISDVDGNIEERGGTISIFNGQVPIIISFKTQLEEIESVCQWIKELREEGLVPEEIGIFVRSDNEIPRAISAIEATDGKYKILNENISTTVGYISVCNMHLAKGLEFRAVAVMACDDEVIPSEERIEQVTDESDLDDVYNTERHLLYVACTRARDRLLVTSVEPASEFLDDLRM